MQEILPSILPNLSLSKDEQVSRNDGLKALRHSAVLCTDGDRLYRSRLRIKAGIHPEGWNKGLAVYTTPTRLEIRPSAPRGPQRRSRKPTAQAPHPHDS